MKPNAELDIIELRALLLRVQKTIRQSPDPARFHMNAFVIAIDSFVTGLTNNALKAGEKIRPLTTVLENNSCKIPYIPA